MAGLQVGPSSDVWMHVDGPDVDDLMLGLLQVKISLDVWSRGRLYTEIMPGALGQSRGRGKLDDAWSGCPIPLQRRCKCYIETLVRQAQRRSINAASLQFPLASTHLWYARTAARRTRPPPLSLSPPPMGPVIGRTLLPKLKVIHCCLRIRRYAAYLQHSSRR